MLLRETRATILISRDLCDSVSIKDLPEVGICIHEGYVGISQTECGGPENRRASASAPRQSRRGRHRCANLANEPRVPCRNIPVIPVDPFGFHAMRTGYAMRRYSVTGAGLTQ